MRIWIVNTLFVQYSGAATPAELWRAAPKQFEVNWSHYPAVLRSRWHGTRHFFHQLQIYTGKILKRQHNFYIISFVFRFIWNSLRTICVGMVFSAVNKILQQLQSGCTVNIDLVLYIIEWVECCRARCRVIRTRWIVPASVSATRAKAKVVGCAQSYQTPTGAPAAWQHSDTIIYIQMHHQKLLYYINHFILTFFIIDLRFIYC